MQEAEEFDIITPRVSAQIVVHEANTLMGMRRGQLSAAAGDEKDPILWWGKAIMYPDCLACSSGVIIAGEHTIAVKELTFDQFMGLPDQITEAWLERVYKTNPHWSPALLSKDEQEKKA